MADKEKEAPVASASGEAHNPTVLIGVSSAELEEELKRRKEEYEAQAPARHIEGLKASIAKQEASLASAKSELAAAQAAAKKGTN